MEISYTYKDEDRPIERASFLPEHGKDGTADGWTIIVEPNGVNFYIPFGAGNFINNAEWKDFTALVNQINKQIGNEP